MWRQRRVLVTGCTGVLGWVHGGSHSDLIKLTAKKLVYGLRGLKVYEEFVEGAKEGFYVAIRIIPFLVAMLLAIGMFRAAGGIDLIADWTRPALQFLHFPTELLPISLMRPLSGSGSLALFSELVKQHGPDSLIARTAGTLYGSTETKALSE